MEVLCHPREEMFLHFIKEKHLSNSRLSAANLLSGPTAYPKYSVSEGQSQAHGMAVSAAGCICRSPCTEHWGERERLKCQQEAESPTKTCSGQDENLGL